MKSKTIAAIENVRNIIPGANKRLDKIRRQMKTGRHRHLGFLHIPKTGGSGINTLGKDAAERGLAFPCSFGHGWRLPEIAKAFPDMRVAFILRDPLERTISGFNSRLRQGRPTYDSPWSPAEAAAFAHLPSVRHYLDALISDDEYHRSALAYAQKHIQHLRWNYTFYFRDPDLVRAQADRIALVGRIEETSRFIDDLCGLAGIAPEKLAGLYARRHDARIKPSSVLASYSEGDIAAMRAALKAEYAIHDALRALPQAEPQGGTAA